MRHISALCEAGEATRDVQAQSSVQRRTLRSSARQRAAPSVPWLAGLALLLVSAAGVQAQGLVPRAAEPGQFEQRLSTPAPPTAPVAPIRVPPAEALPPIVEPARTFVLSAVVIEGATVYEPSDLAPLYSNYLAQEVSLTDVDTILAAITAKYRSDGYVLSRAVAPPQDVELGILRVRIIEGFVERVVFEGDRPGREGLLRAFGEKITTVRPLTLAALERNILLVNDVPGIRVKPSLRALKGDPGAYQLTLSLDHDAVAAFAGLDNRGTRPVGRLQSYVGVDLNSVFGLLERTRAVFFTVPDEPNELLYFQLVHDQPIGSGGTRLTLSASQSFTDAGANLESREVEGSSTRAGLRLRHPILRARKQTLSVDGRFDYMNIEDDVDRLEVFNDRLRVIRVGVEYAFADGLQGTNVVNIDASQGLDILNASSAGSPKLSRSEGRPDFTKVTADVERQQRLGRNWGVRIAARAQKSASTLLSSEEFRLGGAKFGRAYDPSEITGDDGAALSIELQYGRSLVKGLLTSYQLYGFYDLGAAWDANDRRESLASAGGGVRIGLFDRISGSLEIATPLTRPVEATGDKDPRVFFRLSARF